MGGAPARRPFGLAATQRSASAWDSRVPHYIQSGGDGPPRDAAGAARAAHGGGADSRRVPSGQGPRPRDRWPRSCRAGARQPRQAGAAHTPRSGSGPRRSRRRPARGGAGGAGADVCAVGEAARGRGRGLRRCAGVAAARPAVEGETWPVLSTTRRAVASENLVQSCLDNVLVMVGCFVWP
jgi:hypothetical protein